jgi:hypothetical protein
MMTPAKVERLDGYVRVSRVGGRDMDAADSTPAVQRRAITNWVELRGVTIAAWHEDLSAGPPPAASPTRSPASTKPA